MERVELNIPSNPIFERVVRASAAEVGSAIGFSEERVEDLKLAISEAVNNAIDHGNRREAGKLVAVVFESTVRSWKSGSAIREAVSSDLTPRGGLLMSRALRAATCVALECI